MDDQTQLNPNPYGDPNTNPPAVDNTAFYPQSAQPLPTATPVSQAAPSTETLVDIKQKALSQLTPLVSNLDQQPEERFRTIMMLIQASDNQDLIKDAYKVAEAITDEKARAQALLDIVNEINYFTQRTS